MPISCATTFIFDGAHFSGGDTIGYQLLLNNQVVFTTAPSAPITTVPTFVASGYDGFVNQVVVFGRQGYYVLDDFTYRNSIAAPGVPEPASWAMMIVGFGIVGAGLRRGRMIAVPLAA